MKVFGKDIIRQVARDHHGVTFDEIVSRSKAKAIMAARLDAIARLRANNFSVSAIGRLLNRDPSTITHHIYPGYRQRKLAWNRRWHIKRQEALAHEAAQLLAWNEKARIAA